MLQTPIGRFRLVAYAEGISYLLLFALTMPLKYIGEIHWPNQIVGMAHGWLFVAYVFGVVYLKIRHNWTMKVMLLGLLASILPFGTFVFDAKYLPKEA